MRDQAGKRSGRIEIIDAVRGLLLVYMTLSHISSLIPGTWLFQHSDLFWQPLGLFTSAEFFLIVSGVSSAVNYLSLGSDARKPVFFQRVKRLYLHQIFLLLYVLVLAVVFPRSFSAQPGLFIDGLSFWPSLSLGALLVYQPALLDILPIYVSLVFAAPFLLDFSRRKNGWKKIALGSFVVWFFAQFIPAYRPPAPFSTSAFNLLAWQTLFVLGLWVGSRLAPANDRATKSSFSLRPALRILGLAVLAAGFWFRYDDQLQQFPLMVMLGDKRNLGLLRLVNTGALLFLAIDFGRAFRIQKIPGHSYFARIGRSSLQVFTWHVVALFSWIVIRSTGHFHSTTADFGVIVFFLASEYGVARAAQSRPRLWDRAKAWLERRSTLIFSLAAALMPIVFVEGFGHAYREAKIVYFFLIAAFCAFQLTQQFNKPVAPRFSKPLLALLAILSLRIFSLFHAENLGLAFQSIGYAIGTLLIALYVQNSKLSLFRFLLFLAAALTVVFAGSAWAILFHRAIFSDYALFGSSLGLKNSVPMFFMQVLPLILLIPLLLTQSPKLRWISRGVCLLALGLLWAVLAYRTRTAWWMFAVEAALLAIAAILTKSTRLRKALVMTVALGLTALVGLNLIPNRLNWTSATPYTDSLGSLTSLSKSNGRDQIWKVTTEMIAEHPLTGIGSGNYPIHFRNYISRSSADPKTFAFMQKDLPNFNDYLQEAAEVGVLGGLLLMGGFFGLALLSVKKSLRMSGRKRLVQLSLATSLVLTAVAALFDYPLNRPENLLVLAIVLGGVLRTSAFPRWTLRNPQRLFLKLAGGSLVAVAFSMGTSFLLRTPRIATASMLPSAYRLWPWDSFWNSDDYRTLASVNAGLASKFSRDRLEYWPQDPDSLLIAGLEEERHGRRLEAQALIERSLVETPEGRCHWRGLQEVTRLKIPARIPQACQ